MPLITIEEPAETLDYFYEIGKASEMFLSFNFSNCWFSLDDWIYQLSHSKWLFAQ
jgi:hypothetical protein